MTVQQTIILDPNDPWFQYLFGEGIIINEINEVFAPGGANPLLPDFAT